jgi:hypothetical protein
MNHIPLWQSTGKTPGHLPEPLHNSTPSNRRTLGAEEPMDGTIPPPSHLTGTRVMGGLAPTGNIGTQQQAKRDDQAIPQSSLTGIRAP